MRRILTTATLAAITLTSLLAASDPGRPAFAESRSPAVQDTQRVQNAGQVSPVTLPDQSLPPGAVKHPGEKCATKVQPPDGQGCPQPTDEACASPSPRAVGECMAARRAWFDGPNTGNQWACLDRLVTREDRWTTTAGHLAGSYGLPQALPGRKMAAAGTDWQTNPVTQLTWMLGTYLPARYGTPCGAWNHELASGWY